MMEKIVLASGSPRRKEILEQAGLKFEVVESDVREDLSLPRPPAELARHFSRLKAASVARARPGTVVIAADTIVVADGKVLGKPETGEDARRMLRALSAREHSVITGFTVMDAGSGKAVTGAVESGVRFRFLSDEEINAYVGTGEPMGKAGAYAIQGGAGDFVEKLEGDYLNVVGLPLNDVLKALKNFNVELP